MEPIPDYGDKMTLEQFVGACKMRFFINYDGHGYYATDTEMSDELAIPSEICRGIINSNFSHVIWFNK